MPIIINIYIPIVAGDGCLGFGFDIMCLNASNAKKITPTLPKRERQVEITGLMNSAEQYD